MRLMGRLNLCMVYTERAETPADSRGTSHVKTKQRCKYNTSKHAIKSDSHRFSITGDKGQ